MVTHQNKYFYCLILFVITFSSAKDYRWGWEVHRYVNENAVDYLPSEMFFFQDNREYLSQHAVDPDVDEAPGYYHYIDIDYYPEFFDGTLPHNWNDIIELYGETVVTDNGTIPWVIEWWTELLSGLMSSGEWDEVWQVAAELGHYVADSHEPLHLTLNYNGQLTGNYGIHSRYETSMVNAHLSEIPLPADTCIYWENIIDSVFQYIDEIYPYVDSIISADNLAYLQDPSHGETYYDALWAQLDSITTDVIQRAVLDLASLWYSAWINAGSPLPPEVLIDKEVTLSEEFILYQNFPNPFNANTSFAFELPKRSKVKLAIYNLTGKEIAVLIHGVESSGFHKIEWDAGKNPNGVYFYYLAVNDRIQSRKFILLK